MRITTKLLNRINTLAVKENRERTIYALYAKHLKKFDPEYNWVVVHVQERLTTGGVESDPYLRLIITPKTIDESVADMPVKDLALLISLSSFSIDIGKKAYEKLFGQFKEEDHYAK